MSVHKTKIKQIEEILSITNRSLRFSKYVPQECSSTSRRNMILSAHQNKPPKKPRNNDQTLSIKQTFPYNTLTYLAPNRRGVDSLVPACCLSDKENQSTTKSNKVISGSMKL